MPGQRQGRRRLTPWAVALIVATVLPVARATTVAPMPVETLADHAGQVVVGTVAQVRSYFVGDPRRIESAVTLRQIEYLKGAPVSPGDEFGFTVPGGTVGELRMRVGCAPTFAPGDKWVLFLLPTYKTFPVVGITQGAFRIVADARGVERVYSERLEPVTGVDTDGFVQVVGARRTTDHGHRPADAVDLRVGTAPAPADAAEAVAFDEFRARIQPVLDASRDHHLTEPAGRSAPVVFRSVPLRRADGGSSPAGQSAPSRGAALPARVAPAPRGRTPGRRGAAE